ncbi:MAG: hypothetical protein IPM74_17740 [Crocinitomicaceae bacterium]|nr:hypothetical protein [Crocinitomicaceae bacterium]MBK8927690.1 hypothetical protein [Crocinitomicaceae bacterium]
MEVTYEQLKPLIVSQEFEGQMVKLKFKAPNQEQPIESMAYVSLSQEEMMKEMNKQIAKSMATGMAVNTATGLLGSALGGVGGMVVNEAGSIASSQASSAAFNTDKLMKAEMTDERVQTAIVQAFNALKPYYKFENGVWEFIPPKAS